MSMKRVTYVLGYIFSGLIGFFLGTIFGFGLVRISYWLWGEDGLSWIGASGWAVLLIIGGLIGGWYGGARLLIAHGRYYWLSSKKREHRMSFYGLRTVFQISESAMKDIVWAYSYTLVESIVPIMLLCLSIVFLGALLFPFLSYFSLIAASVFGISIMGMAQHITTKFFFPENIVRELKDVNKIWGVYAQLEREKIRTSEQRPRRERVKKYR